MRILLTGANGQLGRCFQDRLPEDWIIFAASSSDLDITDQSAVLSVAESFKPDVIVNAAAYTAVDKAESEPDLATAVNTTGAANLATAAKNNSSRYIHISTDYVFNGDSAISYVETDMTSPLGVYGQSKLAGEIAVTNILPDSLIIRTAWVFSEYGNNFLKTMLTLGKVRDTLGVVADQHGCPTYAGDIASAIITLINIDADGGIYHYCGNEQVSWYEFAIDIFKQANDVGFLTTLPVVNAISSAQYPTPAARPKFSTLNTTKVEQYGVIPSDWKKAIDVVIKRL